MPHSPVRNIARASAVGRLLRNDTKYKGRCLWNKPRKCSLPYRHDLLSSKQKLNPIGLFQIFPIKTRFMHVHLLMFDVAYFQWDCSQHVFRGDSRGVEPGE